MRDALRSSLFPNLLRIPGKWCADTSGLVLLAGLGSWLGWRLGGVCAVRYGDGGPRDGRAQRSWHQPRGN